MPDYLLMINEGDNSASSPAEWSKLLEGHAAFQKKLSALGVKGPSNRLRSIKEGKRVSAAGIQDGPFAESKEALGGYYVLRTKNFDEAVAIAKECPLMPNDSIELRPVMGKVGEIRDDSGVYACAVLGHAPSEKQWMALMDKVDEETQTAFGDNFLGGFRLESPTNGVRISSSKQVMDGPFAEGKEVIGGVALMRFASIDDATAWAKKSPFMKRSTLEIRALWQM